MVAITQMRGPIKDELAVLAPIDCIALGFVPFLGKWFSGGILYEDVSVAVNHGMTDNVAIRLLKDFRQEAAMKITQDLYYPLHSPKF